MSRPELTCSTFSCKIIFCFLETPEIVQEDGERLANEVDLQSNNSRSQTPEMEQSQKGEKRQSRSFWNVITHSIIILLRKQRLQI